MMNGKKVVVVMPAYNAAATLERTCADVPRDIVDEVILVDDCSRDDTIGQAQALGLRCFRHEKNWGYGRNQKTCYLEALKLGADVVIMVHPDYQYTPKNHPGHGQSGHQRGIRRLHRLAHPGRDRPARGHAPLQVCRQPVSDPDPESSAAAKLSEYHTGYRAFSREVLETLPLWENSDDFVFDNQMLAQTIYFGFRIGEVSARRNISRRPPRSISPAA
jgi:glycosyltransferase involved in cell wall biosynthesis